MSAQRSSIGVCSGSPTDIARTRFRRYRSFELRSSLEPRLQAAQVGKHLASSLVPIFLILCQRLGHDPFKSFRNSAQVARQQRRFLFEDGDDYVAWRWTLKRQPACDHFVDNNTETPDVASCV